MVDLTKKSDASKSSGDELALADGAEKGGKGNASDVSGKQGR